MSQRIPSLIPWTFFSLVPFYALFLIKKFQWFIAYFYSVGTLEILILRLRHPVTNLTFFSVSTDRCKYCTSLRSWCAFLNFRISCFQENNKKCSRNHHKQPSVECFKFWLQWRFNTPHWQFPRTLNQVPSRINQYSWFSFSQRRF